MTNLIGITGPARHGKDTVGKLLMKHIPSLQRFAYADKIKEFLQDALVSEKTPEESKEGLQEFQTSYGMLAASMLTCLDKLPRLYGNKDYVGSLVDVLEDFTGDFEETDGNIYFTASWRQLFQIVGTEWGRTYIDEYVWIEPFLPDSNHVITDVRGHSESATDKNMEAKAILDKGGLMIKVTDPRKESPQIRQHSSEAGIDDEFITYHIINDGSLEDLERKVVDFIYIYLVKEI